METDQPITTEQQTPAQPPAAKPNGSGGAATPPPEKLELSTLKDMSVGALTKIAKGLDVPDEMVHSPTFTLIHEYRGRHPLRHCDAYRLKNSDEFTDLGLDELFGEDGVAFVEWADRVAEFIPRDHLRIELTVAGISTRQARFIATGQRSAEIVRRLSLL